MLRPFEVITWVERSGEPLSLARLKMRMIVHGRSSGISMDDINAGTTCSADYMAALRKEAALVVGKPCPLK